MTPHIYPEEDPRREAIFKRGWHGVIFFAGLAICLAVVLIWR
jgi:hypothetical protein